jgi:hypothetical protein
MLDVIMLNGVLLNVAAPLIHLPQLVFQTRVNPTVV